MIPRVVARSNPGLKLANAFGVSNRAINNAFGVFDRASSNAFGVSNRAINNAFGVFDRASSNAFGVFGAQAATPSAFSARKQQRLRRLNCQITKRRDVAT